MTIADSALDEKTIVSLIRPNRRITGMSAILVPFVSRDRVDWDGFSAHVARTAGAGLVPAVNMDTGYVNLIDREMRREVLVRTHEALGGASFVAGAFVGDEPGSAWNADAYRAEIDLIQKHGGIPVIFQSYGLTGLGSGEVVEAYAELGRECPEFIAFELGSMFANFGRIYDLDTYRALLDIPQCTGAKHSSLDRGLEWARLRLRDEVRPDFRVFTGNDQAIDMVMYGSDYLLGLSTFAPDIFARRDACWTSGDAAFHELNDLLQYLGFFAFRAPVPAYKHSAAQFLRLRGWISNDTTHPKSPERPASDIPVLRDIVERMEAL